MHNEGTRPHAPFGASECSSMMRTRAGSAAAANTDLTRRAAHHSLVSAIEVYCARWRACIRRGPTTRFKAKELTYWVLYHLEPLSSWSQPTLSSFYAMRCSGCFSHHFATENPPSSRPRSAISWVNKTMDAIKHRLRASYYHVSSKHVPRYHAEVSLHFNRPFLAPESFPQLVSVAVRTQPLRICVLYLPDNHA